MKHINNDGFATQIAPPRDTTAPCSHTIIIPTKDRPQLLQRALASALQERGSTGEILLVDDHSAEPVVCRKEGVRVIRLAAGQSGVAAARNAGLSAARGSVIFFLDDDDWFVDGYCGRVLSGVVTENYDYGFSSFRECRAGNPETAIKVRFQEGPISRRSPLRKQLCGFGMGFWIKQAVAAEIGPVDDDLTINEDTDYLCRLVLAKKNAWYSATPGVTILRDDTMRAELGHITSRTSPQERARCMRVLCDRYPTLLHHLGKSYLRHCIKAGLKQDVRAFLGGVSDRRMRLNLTIFAGMKMIARFFNPPPHTPESVIEASPSSR